MVGMDETPPHYPLENRTLLWDPISDAQVAWIDGSLILPVGARIRLSNHGADGDSFDAVVTQVGTVATGRGSDGKYRPMAIQLDVMLVRPGAAPDAH